MCVWILKTVGILIWICGCVVLYRERTARITMTKEEYLTENTNKLKTASDHLHQSNYKPPDQPYILLSFLTARRVYQGTNLDYLARSVGSVLQLLRKTGIKDVKLSICDTSSDGDAINADILNVVRPENVYKISNVGDTSKEKQNSDYVTCLKESMRHRASAQFLILNEDDASPIPTYFQHIFQVARQIKQRYLRKGVHDISHVKFFHVRQLRKIPWLIYTFVVPIFLVTLLGACSLLLKRRLGRTLYIISSFCIGILIFALGPDRVGWWHHRLMLGFMPLVPPESCCTPCVFFPFDTLNRTIGFMDTRMDANKRKGVFEPYDTVMDWLPWETSLRVLMTEFNLVKHIGVSSTQNNLKKIEIDQF